MANQDNGHSHVVDCFIQRDRAPTVLPSRSRNDIVSRVGDGSGDFHRLGRADYDKSDEGGRHCVQKID